MKKKIAFSRRNWNFVINHYKISEIKPVLTKTEVIKNGKKIIEQFEIIPLINSGENTTKSENYGV